MGGGGREDWTRGGEGKRGNPRRPKRSTLTSSKRENEEAASDVHDAEGCDPTGGFEGGRFNAKATIKTRWYRGMRFLARDFARRTVPERATYSCRTKAGRYVVTGPTNETTWTSLVGYCPGPVCPIGSLLVPSRCPRGPIAVEFVGLVPRAPGLVEALLGGEA